MIDVVFLAVKDALKQKKLIAVVVLALTIGLCNTAITTGVMKGFERYITEDLVEILGAHLLIMPRIGEEYIPKSQMIIDKLETIHSVKSVLPRSYFMVRLEPIGKTISFSMRNMPTEVDGVDAEKEESETAIAEKITEGRWLKGEPNEIVVGKKIADMFNVEVGDTFKVKFTKGKSKDMKIVGIVEFGSDLVDMICFMNNEDAYDVLGGTGRYNYISVKLYDRDDANEVRSMLLSEGVDAWITTWDEMLGYAKDILNIFSLVLFVVSGVAIITAALSVSVLMYINVIHKTREIGTLKAIGMKKEKILLLFLTEAAIISVVGVMVGNGIAYGIVQYLSQNPIVIPEATIRFSVDYNYLISTSIIAILAVIISAIYPSYVASKREVVEAMRYE